MWKVLASNSTYSLITFNLPVTICSKKLSDEITNLKLHHSHHDEWRPWHGTIVWTCEHYTRVSHAQPSSGDDSNSCRIRQRRGVPRVLAGHANTRVGGKTYTKRCTRNVWKNKIAQMNKKDLCTWVELLSIVVAALVVVAAVAEAMTAAAVVRNSGVPHYHSMVSFFTIFRRRNLRRRRLANRQTIRYDARRERATRDETSQGIRRKWLWRVRCTYASSRRKDRESRVRATETL